MDERIRAKVIPFPRLRVCQRTRNPLPAPHKNIINFECATMRRGFIFRLQDGICAYCGCAMTLELGLQTTCTREHVIPRSRGGPKTIFNVVAACYKCNKLKRDRDAEEFLRSLRDKPEFYPNARWKPHKYFRGKRGNGLELLT